jgi:hypothetical protein
MGSGILRFTRFMRTTEAPTNDNKPSLMTLFDKPFGTTSLAYRLPLAK